MSTRKRCIRGIGLGLSLILSTSMVMAKSHHNESKPLRDPHSTASNKPPRMYRPPPLGQPIATTGAASRGLNVPTPFVLAPQHVALTARDQADLYWYLPDLTAHAIILTIIDYEGRAESPLLEKRLSPPTQPLFQER